MFTTKQFTYAKERRTLIADASDLGIGVGRTFPKTLLVKSHYTGRLVEWVYDQRAAERAEWWDGMEAHYLPVESVNAEHLIIIND